MMIAALAVGAVVMFSGIFNANILTTLTLPLLILVFSTLLYKVAKSIRRKSLQLFGRAFLNLAIIVLLIGVFVSAGAKSTVTLNDVKMNTPVDAIQLKIELSNLAVSNSSTVVYNEILDAIIPEYSIVQADVTIQESGQTYDGTLDASYYPNYGIIVKPLIIGTATGDIYLHFDLENSDSMVNALTQAYTGNSTVPDQVSITVQNSPLIYLVWSGVVLMLVGISVQFAGDLKLQQHDLRRINS